MEIKQKWIKEGAVFYPIPGNTTFHASPGDGVFQVYESRSMSGTRLGLLKIADKFSFNFKIYDLGIDDTIRKIKTTWNSDIFVDGNKNLGVIFNGLKGTGKTIAAKILSNQLGMPVVVINAAYEGVLDFIQSLCFECVVLIDEAEKTFRDNGDVLLKMIDGVYNESRKLYILTTNHLNIDENLLGRPGRIRYIKQFGNLTVKAVSQYIKDNLHDLSMTQQVINAVDMLEISTIDILKSIVDEINIHGEITEDSMLNIPKENFKIRVVKFCGLREGDFEDMKKSILSKLSRKMSIRDWLNQERGEEDGESVTNATILEKAYNMDCYAYTLNSPTATLYKNQKTYVGTLVTDPDNNGFFITKNSNNENELCCIIHYFNAPSLYRGELQAS